MISHHICTVIKCALGLFISECDNWLFVLSWLITASNHLKDFMSVTNLPEFLINCSCGLVD